MPMEVLSKGNVKAGRVRGRITLVLSQMLGLPVLADVDRIVTSIDIANGAQVIAAQPDVPRSLTVTVTDANASITAGTVTIVGTDPQGRTVTEVLTLPTLTLTGTKIFASVTSVTVASLAGAAAGDTITVGVGNKIGLPFDILKTSAVKHTYLGGTRVAAPTVAVGTSLSSVDASAATYDGAKALQVLVDVGG